MRMLILSGTVLLAATVGAAAQSADPVGEWLVKDGTARIKVVSCPTNPNQPPLLWGVIWAETNPGFDEKNPDPTQRNRPMLGVPILVGMKSVQPNKWEGKIYDPTRGSLWDAKLSLSRTDMLEVRGCFGFICDGEDWRRVTGTNTPPLHQPPPTPATTKGGAMAAPGGTMAKGGAMTKAGPAPAVDPVCKDVANLVPRG
jgi:uncharacterized protein (DUF2147 family)